MTKLVPPSSEMIGQDSFLDVVTNTVGIIIILVVVVGIRVKQAVLEGPDADATAAAPAAASESAKADPAELQSKQAESASLESEIRSLAEQSLALRHETELRRLQREQLATMLAAAKEQLSLRRANLDGSARQKFDLDRSLTAARAKLDELAQRKAAWDQTPGQVVTVQSLPTPISKAVLQREAHFRLQDGRLTFVPLDELVESLKKSARAEAQDEHKFRDGVLADEIGPIGGFTLRYWLGRKDAVPGRQPAPVSGYYVELIKFQLVPVEENLGEPIDAALAPGSRFRAILARLDAARTTITIWVYPECFLAYRQLKAELHSLGFATAARPLPTGELIGGSPDGSRSAAE